MIGGVHRAWLARGRGQELRWLGSALGHTLPWVKPRPARRAKDSAKPHQTALVARGVCETIHFRQLSTLAHNALPGHDRLNRKGRLAPLRSGAETSVGWEKVQDMSRSKIDL